MGGIVGAAIYSLLGKFFLFFIIVPIGIIFLGYVIYIIAEVIKEVRKNSQKPMK